MVQFRRLDPLANAGPYQRLLKTPVKSFTLSEAEYDRVKARRPELIATEGEAAVIGLPQRDLLAIHYGFPEVEAFRDRFGDLFNRVVKASSREEAPRGVLVSFRDRPNRSLADTVFWLLGLEEGAQWVEMSLISAPEQPEPPDSIGDGFQVREASDADRNALAEIESESSGQPRLSETGLTSLFEDSRWLWVVTGPDRSAVAFLALKREPGGWGIIDQLHARSSVAAALRRPLIEWAVAFLRSNGGRRVRYQLYVSDSAGLAILRGLGFTAGETGLEYTRPVDDAEIKAKMEERQAHGTLIKFGDWR